MNLNEKIKYYRNNLKMTQKDLADRAEISLRALVNYEKGTRMPSMEVLIKLSKALNISVESLQPQLIKSPEIKYLFAGSGKPSLKESMLSQVGTTHGISEEILKCLEQATNKEKEIILTLVEYYNTVFYDNKYDLSKFDDEHIQDLKLSLHGIIKAALKDCTK